MSSSCRSRSTDSRNAHKLAAAAAALAIKLTFHFQRRTALLAGVVQQLRRRQ